MILHLVKCEMCEEQFSFQPMQQAYHKAPDSWLVLYHAKDIHVQDGWHFCSKWCLSNWLDKQRTSNEIKVSEHTHEPYTNCCSTHYPVPVEE